MSGRALFRVQSQKIISDIDGKFVSVLPVKMKHRPEYFQPAAVLTGFLSWRCRGEYHNVLFIGKAEKTALEDYVLLCKVHILRDRKPITADLDDDGLCTPAADLSPSSVDFTREREPRMGDGSRKTPNYIESQLERSI